MVCKFLFFLGLLFIANGYKDPIVMYSILIDSLKRWELDSNKFIGLGSDGASTIIGSKNDVLAPLKKLNFFLYLCIV